jgi:peptidoglycan/LPS O-acetylase OafA/YrhL
MKNSSFEYRKEIDGFRALAILPVVFYHAGIKLFSGGFVGVDVFFVISGYLITNIILSDIENKKFSLKNFYERRARRILPALLLVSVTCIPFSFLFFKDIYLLEFTRSLVSLIFFSSNFLFWSESGYFNTNTEFKPLIHTWSLSVEEQFYILFPIILLFLFNFFKFFTKIFFIILFTLSLLFCVWGSFNYPNATFYLLPFRGWEIILGVLTAIYLYENKIKFKKVYNEFFSIIGFFLIFISIIFLDSKTVFPGYVALLPTIGTVLLITFCRKGTTLYKVFTIKYLINLGLISYSLYLWHQPILAFVKFYLLNEFSLYHKLFVILISIIISYFSWKYFESPFRNKQKISNKNLLLFLCLPIIIFFSTWGYVVKFSNLDNIYTSKPKQFIGGKKVEYFESKFDIQINSKNAFYDAIKPKNRKANIKVLVIGDSHAQGYNLMGEYYADKYQIEWHSYIFTGCPPIFGYYKIYNIEQIKPSKKQNECKDQVKIWENFIKENGKYFDYVILSSRWNFIFNHEIYEKKQYRKDALIKNNEIFINNNKIQTLSRSNFTNGLKNTINIINNNGPKVVIFSQPPLLIRNPIRCMGVSKISYDYCANAKFKSIKERGLFVKNTILSENKLNNIDNLYLILENYLCDEDKEKCISKKNNKLLYKDDDHLSYEGVFYISQLWETKDYFPFKN